MYRLINEVDDLLQQILGLSAVRESLSYQFVFQEYVMLIHYQPAKRSW